MSDMRMVDTEDNREDRKAQAGSDAKPEVRRLPNRRQRRLIAKQRGIFKHSGLWPHINNRASNETERQLNGDQDHDTQE